MNEPHPKLLTISDAAARLNVSPKTVRRWIDRRELAAFKLGHQWRIEPEDLERFLWHCRQGTAVREVS